MQEAMTNRLLSMNVLFQLYLVATIGLSIVAAILMIAYHILVGREEQ